MERIKFRCPSCSKALAVDVAHAGKAVACPGCKTRLTIPAAPLRPASSPTAAADDLPTVPDPLAPAQNPFPSFGTESMPSDATSPLDMEALPPAADLPSGGSLPVTGFPTPTSPTPTPRETTPETSLGKSVAGLLVAILVAGVLSIVWLIVIAVTGLELGILAWAMGGAIGLVAGVIGRNPSPVYCGLVAGIAAISVLATKGFLVLALMAMSWTAEFAMDLAEISPERQKLVHAMADQMLADGRFEGLEKQYAEFFVNSYFSGSVDMDEEMSEMFEISDGVDERIRNELDAKTPEEQQQLVEAARLRHPDWIEDHNHYMAAIDAMLNEEGALSDELAAHARSEFGWLDDARDETYYETTTPAELKQRRTELRKLAAERINKTDPQQRDQAVRDTLQGHLNWNPYPDARTAMMEKMQQEGAFSGPLAEHAKATIQSEIEDEYSDYFDNISDEVNQARDKELNSAVNQKLVSMDIASRTALIEETKSRYPDWHGQAMTLEESQEELKEAFDEIGTDGTFWGNVGAVFGIFDLLWLFLGASTAFGTARKYGTKE